MSASIYSDKGLAPYISGPNPATLCYGSSENFTASPNFLSPARNYEWSVVPSTGTSITGSGNHIYVYFSNSGSYTVRARSYNDCYTQNGYITVTVNVN